MTTIEELAPEHFDIVAGWLSEPAVNRWLTSEWRDRVVTPILIGMVVRKKTQRLFLIRWCGEPCGVAGLADLDSLDATAMVWYVLGSPALAGRGIATQAVLQLAELSFAQLGLTSLYAWIMEDNTPSRRVLERVGFREVGRVRAAALSAGRRVDRVYFDLIADDLRVVSAERRAEADRR